MALLKRLRFYGVFFIALETIIRISLLVRADVSVIGGAGDVANIFLRGFLFDSITAVFVFLPIAFYHLCLRQKSQGGKSDRRVDAGFRFLYCAILLFSAVSEHLFWSEFRTRFNFIAVDYLIYTTEVIANIRESYPLPLLLSAIGLCAAIIAWASLRFMPLQPLPQTPFYQRLKHVSAMAALAAILYVGASGNFARFNNNAEAGEVTANGIYELFRAYWNNEIDYAQFYTMQPEEEIWPRIHALLSPKVPDTTPLQSLKRPVTHAGKENHANVMVVVMESMSAEFMGQFGNKQNLTPELDQLAREGLTFTDLYATGTRTVRGLEAVTLSVPPTPGQSIVRRPQNSGLFSLGALFAARGYQNTFIYGGYGYFDNMNAFFAGNGFSILDKGSMKKDEIEFANAWGVCDGDMFTRAIKQGDASYAAGKRFLHVIMTTSNHRPFTYPAGKIEAPEGHARFAAIRYSDYAVGKLVEEARKKPWFDNTVFVFVADHTAGAGGKAELDANKYHIPMIFYAPKLIKPQQITTLASQIDLAPTLLGLLNFSYESQFYGIDWRHPEGAAPRALISNYQKVALAKGNTLTVLAPKQKIEQFDWPAQEQNKTDGTARDEAISYYQSASHWREVSRWPGAAKP